MKIISEHMCRKLELRYILWWTLALVLEAINGSTANRIDVPAPIKKKYPALIMFGDSIADAGNNNHLASISKCNFPPYGRDFPGGVPTGRFCNGMIFSDYLAQNLGIEDLLPAYNDPELKPEDLLTGVTFASGGSGFDPLTPTIFATISLPEQLSMFKDYKEKVKEIIGEEGADDLISKTIYWLIAGSNDIANTYFATHLRQVQFNFSVYSDFLLNKASEFIQEMYDAGAREIWVLGVSPLGCLPASRTLAGGVLRQCGDDYNEASKIFNAELNILLTSLNATLSGVNLRYVDCYVYFLDIIQNHQTYGFKVVDRGCCGTGNVEVSILCPPYSPFTCSNASEYVFWDSYHPSDRAYQILVAKIFENINL